MEPPPTLKECEHFTLFASDILKQIQCYRNSQGPVVTSPQPLIPPEVSIPEVDFFPSHQCFMHFVYMFVSISIHNIILWA